LRTWLRMWPSRSSAIKLFIAPLAALITCRTSEQSRSSSRVRTRASTCPRMRFALRRRFCFSLIVWLIVLIVAFSIYHTWYGTNSFFCFVICQAAISRYQDNENRESDTRFTPLLSAGDGRSGRTGRKAAKRMTRPLSVAEVQRMKIFLRRHGPSGF